MENKNRLFIKLSLVGQAAIMLIAPVLVLLFLGIWLDDILKTSPMLTIAGTFSGFIGSIYNIYKIITRLEK